MTTRLHLVAPFLAGDDKVKKLFDELILTDNTAMKIVAIGQMLTHNEPVNQDTLLRLATDERTAWSVYRNMADQPYFSHVEKWFQDTQALAKAYVIYNFGEVDSVRFISKHRATLYGQPSNLFFFDTKVKKSADWKLAYVNMPIEMVANNASVKNKYFRTPNASIPRITEGEREEYISKKIGEMRFLHRNRVSSSDGYETTYDYDEY